MPDPIHAFIWDFDGTLVDTRERNFAAAQRVFRQMGRDPEAMPAFASLEAYEAAHRRTANWREFYRQGLGFAEEEIDVAGRLWTEQQLADDSPLPLLPGVVEMLAALAEFRHAIVSQNCRKQIERTLARARLGHRFERVVGYEEVPIGRQKPAPDGLLGCIDHLACRSPGVVYYVGDHETDMLTAANAARALAAAGSPLRIETIAALFLPGAAAESWSVAPNHVAGHPGEIIEIQRRGAGA